jgi:acyl carrier protein
MSGPQFTPERLNKRLRRIFTSVFPDLDADAAPEATMANVKGWDSMATLALFMQCEEDLGLKIGYDRIAETKSYADLYALIEGLAA